MIWARYVELFIPGYGSQSRFDDGRLTTTSDRTPLDRRRSQYDPKRTSTSQRSGRSRGIAAAIFQDQMA